MEWGGCNLRDVHVSWLQAAGEVDVRVKVRLQSRMLDALFEIFFRVLKSVEASGSAEVTQLQHANSPPPARKSRCRYPSLCTRLG